MIKETKTTTTMMMMMMMMMMSGRQARVHIHTYTHTHIHICIRQLRESGDKAHKISVGKWWNGVTWVRHFKLRKMKIWVIPVGYAVSIGKPLQADWGCVATSVNIYQGTQRNMSEDLNFQHYHCQNLICVRKYSESEDGTHVVHCCIITICN